MKLTTKLKNTFTNPGLEKRVQKLEQQVQSVEQELEKELEKVKEKETDLEKLSTPQVREVLKDFFEEHRGEAFVIRDLLEEPFGVENADAVKSSDSRRRKVYDAVRDLKDRGEVNRARKNSVTYFYKGEVESFPEKTFTCPICGDEFDTPYGISAHKSHVHSDAREKNKEEETEEEVEDVEDFMERVPVEIEEKWRDGDTFEPSEIELEDRIPLIKHILSESSIPLTKTELTEKLFNTDTGTKFGEPRRNRVESAMQKLRDQEEVVEGERLTSHNRKAFTLPSQISSGNHERAGSEEEGESSRLSTAQSKSGVGDSELRSIENTFSKLVHMGEKEEITYYDFEQNYGGNLGALNSWQKLFQHPVLLEETGKRVLPDGSKFKWSKTGGTGVKSWVVEVQ